MSDEKQIAKIGLDEDGAPTMKEPIFVSISDFRNNKYLNIRKYYEVEGEWRPTKKGIALSYKNFKELLNVLNENADKIEEWMK